MNPVLILKTIDSIKIVLVARHLNSNTDQSSESWPLEPSATQLAMTINDYKYAIDPMYAYARAT